VSNQNQIPTEYLLTTVDNPFDPFEEFDSWYEYDIRLGYNSLAMLDRIAKVPSDLPPPDTELAIQDAIDEIVAENVSGMWKKVSRNEV
jgi:hypothetical protein